jgi:fatty acid desaturase
MTERDQQFLALYQKHRFQDQRAFYDSRRREFEAARDQVLWLTTVFMVLTAAAAALASANLGGLTVLWSILAVAFPALSTALSAYNALYAFERQAKIYGDAANALLRARADSPDLKPAMDDSAFHQALGAHVEQVEQILGNEQAQWGQLIGEIKPVEPPSSKT